MLGNHELHHDYFFGVGVVLRPLQRHQFVAFFNILQFKVASRHLLDLVVLCDANDRQRGVLERGRLAILARLLVYALSHLFFDVSYGRVLTRRKCQRDRYDGLDKAEWVVSDLVSRLACLSRDRNAKHVEGVEGDADVAADGAVDAGLELAVEKFDEDRVVAHLERIPKLLGYYRVRPAVAVLHFDVGFLAYRIGVLMHCFEQNGQHFLTVVLGKALELHSFAGDPRLHIPRR